MDENDICFDDEAPGSEHNRLLRIAAWAEENNLLGPDREPRKILGTVPVTADGAIVGGNALVFLRENGVTAEYMTDNFCGLCRHLGNGCCHTFVSMHRSAKVLHSTSESAERAAKGGGDGQ